MRTDRSLLLGLFIACTGLSVLAGCPGKLDDKELFIEALNDAGAGAGAAAPVEAGASAGADGDAGPCGDVVTRIFVPSCGGSGCHSATAPQQGLDLVSPGVAARIVGVTAKGCAVTLADPKNAAGSLMYEKLSSMPPCGAPMPLARPPLSDEDAACVLAWIAAQ